ncbi:rap guanine nucleotide exchange factor 4-like protein, partial [Dinothrombium tinctorium]
IVSVHFRFSSKDVVTLCTLGVGNAFGESVLSGKPHSVSVVTNEACTLLRVRREEFQDIWQKNSHLMEDIVSPFNNLNTSLNKPYLNNGTQASSLENASFDSSGVIDVGAELVNDKNSLVERRANVSLSITKEPSSQILRIGWVLRTIILVQAPQLIRDRKFNLHTVCRKCMVGSELVDWLMSVSSTTPIRIHSRSQAAAMWQPLVEEGVLCSVSNECQFLDKYVFYRFWFDGEGIQKPPAFPTDDERRIAENELHQSLAILYQLAPDAMFRLILRKPKHERSNEEIDAVYEELMHIKALSHLTSSVKRELASVISFESHHKQGTVLFNQGDVGQSWYVILRGSVNVMIIGKGIVCTLNEGDDFGKLALVNDAPRAATIITNEDNCHFLRVDKEDFNRILRDVEANTVRLKEHGKDVLLLQRIPGKVQPANGSGSHYKYTVMAGTPEKMLEHLLETRIDVLNDPDIGIKNSQQHQQGASSLSPSVFDSSTTSDTFLEDFLLTRIIFLPTPMLCKHLMKHYQIDKINSRQEREFIIANKRRVIRFMNAWSSVVRESFFDDQQVKNFLNELNEALKQDAKKYERAFDEEVLLMDTLMHVIQRYDEDCELRGVQKWKADLPGPIRRLSVNGIHDHIITITMNNNNEVLTLNKKVNRIRPKDEIIFRIYCADHTYTTLKTTVDTTASVIKTLSADKLSLCKDEGELILAEVKSSGERFLFKDTEVSIQTGLSVNGKIFISLIDHIDALTPLPEQEGPKESNSQLLDDVTTQEIAVHLTQYAWSLFENVHEYELIYQVFGRHNFGQITANLDVFLRHFNEIQYWVVTEIVLTTNLSRRVQLLRKFIKVAELCKEYQNLNTFFAITMGLSNIAVSRLSQTWERLPNKLKRTFSQYESLIDPSRNHRRYRVFLSKLEPPIIPFTPLLLKDMTFAHEGNKTFLDKGLINFEKMQMISQTLRIIRYCRSRPMKLEIQTKNVGNAITSSSSSPSKKQLSMKIHQYIRELKVIDNQRLLTQYSHALEHRKS